MRDFLHAHRFAYPYSVSSAGCRNPYSHRNHPVGAHSHPGFANRYGPCPHGNRRANQSVPYCRAWRGS